MLIKIMDPYQVLKINEDASDDEVKKALKRASVKYHPDKVKDERLKKLNEDKFKEAQKAYENIMALRKNFKNRSDLSRRSHNDFMHNMMYRNTLFEDEDFFDTRTNITDIFEEMEERMKAMNIKSDRGNFYSKSTYTVTKNGKTITKVDENMNGNRRTYESYDSRHYLK